MSVVFFQLPPQHAINGINRLARLLTRKPPPALIPVQMRRCMPEVPVSPGLACMTMRLDKISDP